MKIGILGLGYVGSAVAWTHRHHEVIKRDPKFGNDSATINEIMICDAIYICVPTPMLENGRCDDSYVKSVLAELQDYKKVIICKSTVPPGVYQELQQRYPNLVHAPEFLTAANATADYENSSWVLVGGNEKWVDSAIEIIKQSSISATYYHKTDVATASLFKYTANSFLATKVTFMNDMFQLAKKLNVDWNEIKTISKNDSRLGSSHWDVPGPDGMFGYGGACFPKDVSAIVEHAAENDIEFKLLKSVKSLNEIHRKLA